MGAAQDSQVLSRGLDRVPGDWGLAEESTALFSTTQSNSLPVWLWVVWLSGEHDFAFHVRSSAGCETHYIFFYFYFFFAYSRLF